MLMDRDTLGTDRIRRIEFQNVLQRVHPKMELDIIYSLFKDHQDSDDKCNYRQFLNMYLEYKNKRKVVDTILETMYYKYSSSDVSLFELFDESDRNKDGNLDEKEFQDCLRKFGVTLSNEQLDALLFFVDLNGNKLINYKELRTFFDGYLKSQNKSMDDLARSSYTRNPQGYWGRDIIFKAQEYFNKNNTNVEFFFKNHGSISYYDFSDAVRIFYPELAQNDQYRLEKELEVEGTNRLSIDKFQKIYNAITSSGAGGGTYGGAGQSQYGGGYQNRQRFNELIDEIHLKIKAKYFNLEDFFRKYDYNQFNKVIPSYKFDDALREINVYPSRDDQDLLRQNLDPQNTGKYDVAPILNAKPNVGGGGSSYGGGSYSTQR